MERSEGLVNGWLLHVDQPFCQAHVPQNFTFTFLVNIDSKVVMNVSRAMNARLEDVC